MTLQPRKKSSNDPAPLVTAKRPTQRINGDDPVPSKPSKEMQAVGLDAFGRPETTNFVAHTNRCNEWGPRSRTVRGREPDRLQDTSRRGRFRRPLSHFAQLGCVRCGCGDREGCRVFARRRCSVRHGPLSVDCRCYAEYVAVPANELAHSPANVSESEIGETFMAAVAAWQAIVPQAGPLVGQRILGLGVQ